MILVRWWHIYYRGHIWNPRDCWWGDGQICNLWLRKVFIDGFFLFVCLAIIFILFGSVKLVLDLIFSAFVCFSMIQACCFVAHSVIWGWKHTYYPFFESFDRFGLFWMNCCDEVPLDCFDLSNFWFAWLAQLRNNTELSIIYLFCRVWVNQRSWKVS